MNFAAISVEVWVNPTNSSSVMALENTPALQKRIRHLYHHLNLSFDAECSMERVFPWVRQLSLTVHKVEHSRKKSVTKTFNSSVSKNFRTDGQVLLTPQGSHSSSPFVLSSSTDFT